MKEEIVFVCTPLPSAYLTGFESSVVLLYIIFKYTTLSVLKMRSAANVTEKQRRRFSRLRKEKRCECNILERLFQRYQIEESDILFFYS